MTDRLRTTPATSSTGLGLIFPILLLGAVAVLVVPLPPQLLDILLSANLTLSVLILLTTVRVRRPLEFSVFPVLLLWTALARVVLNVASTRLILTRGGEAGLDAAGGLISGFGQFVTAGSPEVGLILFLILVVIQFVVVTSGAGRISEVAARFALDGMPGRQLAVDADLASGQITAAEARQRRREIAQQADFYGAMDGASKFVRGDAIAGLIITVVNIVGGLLIGVLQNGMTLQEAASIFTVLTIGDGLVSQVPGLLIALASGLIVTRSSVETDLARDTVSQVFRHPEVLYLAAAFVVMLAFTGLPMIPLLTLGGSCFLIGEVLRRGQAHDQLAFAAKEIPRSDATPVASAAPSSDAKSKSTTRPEESLTVEPLALELGAGLIRLADASAGGDFLERVAQVRAKIASELGFILPKVRIYDNLRLDPRQYQIKLRDAAVAWGNAYYDALLAIDSGQTAGNLTGIFVDDALTGRRAVWIDPKLRDEARSLGWLVLEPTAVITRHFNDVVRRHADELLTRQHVHQLLDHLRQRAPQLARELEESGDRPGQSTARLSVWQVHRVLANLLRENVPIRDLETIVETLVDDSHRTADPSELTESVRRALARTICQQYRNEQCVLHAVMLPTEMEERLAQQSPRTPTSTNADGATLATATRTDVLQQTIRALGEGLRRLTVAGHPQVVVCRPENRRLLRQVTAAALPRLAVLSHEEISRDTELTVHRG